MAALCIATFLTSASAQDYIQAAIDVEDLFARVAELQAQVEQTRGAGPEQQREALELRAELSRMIGTFSDLQGEATDFLVDENRRGAGVEELHPLLEFIDYIQATNDQLHIGTEVADLIAADQIVDDEGSWDDEDPLTRRLYSMAQSLRSLWRQAIDYRPDEYLRQFSGD